MNRICLSWDDVFPISMEGCAKWMQGGAFDYLLDGRTCNMTVIEQTLEIFDRMGLTDEECRFLGGDEVALYFKGFYDRFTRYIRENAIMTEYLQYNQFLKQLRKSELFVETRAVRFAGGEPKKAHILNYARVREVCDVEGFLKAPVDAAL
jgi:hypothetical protein